MRFARSLTFGLIVAGALSGVAAIAVPAVEETHQRPRPIELQTSAQSVSATRGSYCVSSTDPHSPQEGTGICADAAYPLPVHSRLRLKPGQLLALRTHDLAIGSIRISLERVHGDDFEDIGEGFSARPRAGHPARWIAKLPDDPRGANRIDIFLRYKHRFGDASFSAGLKVR